ncbi:MAG: thiaminase II [Terriglobales bacterium]|jgi:thiaminase/transcriptional activator TenA
MAERFTERLRQKAAGIWEAQHQHPFVRGIGDGTLSLERFKFWLRQDYVFLIEYARLLALAAARSPELETMTRFATLFKETVETEMNLHRAYAAEFGISREELERELPAPTTRGYTDFLLRVGATGDFAELAAALLPCMWAFSEIGQRLAAQPAPSDMRYAKWVAMYSSREFAELAHWCRDLLDNLAAGLPERELRKLETAFLASSRYEWLFWEMAWKMKQWPI